MSDNAHLEYPERFHSFIVFEPASLRIHDGDILVIGEEVKNFFDELMGKLLARKQTLKEQILHNKLVKIGHMLELLNRYDQVLITRYFDRIWRRYSYISHLGESFLNLDILHEFFPDYKNKEGLIAQRYDSAGDSEETETETEAETDKESKKSVETDA